MQSFWERLTQGNGWQGEEAERGTRRILVLSGLIALTASSAWVPVLFLYGFVTAGWLMAFNAGLMGVKLVWLYFSRSWRGPLYFLLTCNLLVAVALHWVVGGFVATRGLLFSALVGPIFAAFLLPTRQAIAWLLVSLSTISLAVVAAPALPEPSHLPQWLFSVMTIHNLALPGATAAVAVMYAVHQVRRERERSEQLLLNILPADVAATLKNGASTIADHHGAASVLFADIVDFTPLSARLTPLQTVELLNAVFSDMDALAEKHGLEKIKTVGDCYMVAAGVPRPRPDHARATALLALEMMEQVGARHGVRMRIGIASGPVVAGVIGRKKFSYDLWGDTVNLASRMESHGEPGRIQVAPDTYELLRSQFRCEYRGQVTVKGKGAMDTWYLVGERG